jgi:hypothetical protein
MHGILFALSSGLIAFDDQVRQQRSLGLFMAAH